MSRIHFFATGADMLSLLGRLEDEFDIEYVEDNRLAAPTPQRWKGVANLPSLGFASGDQEIACTSFLIMERDADVNVASMLMFDGETRYDVYPLNNPSSVLLRFGGLWEDGSLISGHLISSSDGPFSKAVMKALRKGIRKSFTKVRAFWVGQEAMNLFHSGRRLCYAIQSPPEYNLREETT